ncbi:hypothetical protein IE81DRAFT_327231 [Ceraceosorus guamensis]|uniref:Amino acid transporter transmembrane domain-containing protein n=1 Tax=Ceraceosorus guamensis TaxID=1522189 RepID=A0A316VR97_9BASI|nr:hypothetical protein IE81DRAFT_327231 [Ceraceosorus guamensis]PWN38701.1 hypothetical protein IE81DRAFT_327231 [Ceraceosorus guamensis]
MPSISAPVAPSGPPSTPSHSHAQSRSRSRHKSGQASLLSSTANLANTVLGTGMLATPGAFKYVGLLPGIFLVLLCGAMSAAGLLLVCACARTMGGRKQSFFSVAKATVPKGARWFDAAIAVKCFGVSISYLIIIGQLMPQVVLSMAKLGGGSMEDLPLWTLARGTWIAAGMAGLVPLCFLRRLDSLRHTSYLSLVAVLYLVLIVVLYSVLPSYRSSLPPRGEVHWIVLSDANHFVSMFPVFVFAFTCAQNCLPVFNELRSTPERHFERMRISIYTSLGAAAGVYMIVAILGYTTFGSLVSSNIIAMYPSSSTLVAFARIAIVVLVAFSYPLQVHPCRAALDKVLAPSDEAHISPDSRSADAQVADPGDGSPQDASRYTDDEPSAAPRPKAHNRAAREQASDAGESDDEEEMQEEEEARRALLLTRAGADPLLPIPTGRRRSQGGAGAEATGVAPTIDDEEMSLERWCILTAFILASTFVIAMLIDDLGLILGFVGSIGSTTISFILPGILYSSLHPRTDKWRRPAQALAIYGGIVMLLTLSANVLKLIRAGGEDKDHRHPHEEVANGVEQLVKGLGLDEGLNLVERWR